MSNEPILKIPVSVTEDVSKFRGEVKKFLDGDMTPVAFRAYRVPMGIYEQREEGKFMVRIRVGAGLVKPYQLRRISELSRKYGTGVDIIVPQPHMVIRCEHGFVTVGMLAGRLAIGICRQAEVVTTRVHTDQ